MKQVRVKFPAKKVDDICTGLYEVGFVTIASWKNEAMFDDTIEMIGVIPDDKVSDFQTKFSKIIC